MNKQSGSYHQHYRTMIAAILLLITGIVTIASGCTAKPKPASLASTNAGSAQPLPPPNIAHPLQRASVAKRFIMCPGYAHGNRQARVVALTFDDGPSPYTEPLLDLLAQQQVPATFFVIGANVQRYPQLLRRIYQDGHLVGNHTYQHQNLAKLNEARARATLLRSAQLIHYYLGVYPRFFRSPYGACNPASLQAARELQLISVNWNATADDYHVARTSSQQIAAEIMRLVAPGSIIDLHDGGGDRHKTVAAVQLLIQWLRQAGYRIVPLSELIGQRPYYNQLEWSAILAKSPAPAIAAEADEIEKTTEQNNNNNCTQCQLEADTSAVQQQLQQAAAAIAHQLEQRGTQQNAQPFTAGDHQEKSGFNYFDY